MASSVGVYNQIGDSDSSYIRKLKEFMNTRYLEITRRIRLNVSEV